MNDGFHEFFDQTGRNANGHDGGPPAPPKSRRQMRRMRARRKRKRVAALMVALVVVVAVTIGVVYGVGKFKAWYDSRSGTVVIEDWPGPGEGEVQFIVESGQGADDIAANLVDAGIVKSRAAFTSAVAANGSVLYPGTYTLRKRMAAADVVAILSDQTKATGFLEVRSGERIDEVIAHAAKASGIATEEFDGIIDSGGAGLLPPEAGGRFEGWFEPGTYEVRSKGSASEILASMVQARIAKLDDLGVPAGERQRFLTIASIAEAEVNSTQYYGKVVRVILNRLDANMPLGMDTTVAYGLGISASKLTDGQLSDSSNPYNTRIHTGLPPTPISNPGDNAIEATLNPPAGDWLYFVTVNLQTGETKFATTEEEFWTIRDEYKKTNKDAN